MTTHVLFPRKLGVTQGVALMAFFLKPGEAMTHKGTKFEKLPNGLVAVDGVVPDKSLRAFPTYEGAVATFNQLIGDAAKNDGEQSALPTSG